MLTVMQTNFNGIDGLELKEAPMPQVTSDGVIIEMDTLPITPTDWKSESNPRATDEQFSNLPRVIGFGGVGYVTEVGENRDSKLLNKRVFVMNPNGAYSQYMLSRNEDFIFELPDQVDNASAATLIAGPGIAMKLKEEIEQSSAKNIVITGGNSVIALYLLQMIQSSQKNIWPIVSPISKSYFNEQLPNKAAYTVDELPKDLKDVLIIDIAGSESLLNQFINQLNVMGVTSIVMQENNDIENFKFVHEEFKRQRYQQFIQQLANGELKAPVGRIFPVEQVKEAQYFVKESHSRGRVLVTFGKD